MALSSSHARVQVGKYKLGRTMGEGTFTKVKFARNCLTGENFAIKILDKANLLKHKMTDQSEEHERFINKVTHLVGVLAFGAVGFLLGSRDNWDMAICYGVIDQQLYLHYQLARRIRGERA